MRQAHQGLHERWMLGVAATAHRATKRLRDAAPRDAMIECDQAEPPLRVARAGAHVDGFVARDADVLLVHRHDEDGEQRERDADHALARQFRPAQLHWRASAAKQIRRCGSSALAMKVTSAAPGVVGVSKRTQPSSTPATTDATRTPAISTASLPRVRG